MCRRHRMSHVENKKRKNNLHTFKKEEKQTLSIYPHTHNKITKKQKIFNIEIEVI